MLKTIARPWLALLACAPLLLAACGGGSSGSPPAALDAAPGITQQPQSLAVLPGSVATFAVVATGTGPLSYQWRRAGTAIPGAVGSSYTAPATSTTDNGAAFGVLVSNSAGAVSSTEATLTVSSNAIPAGVATNPQSASVLVGAAASFSVTPSGTGPFTYQWRRGGAAIAGATRASYTTAATSLADDGASFDVVIGNATSTSTSAKVVLTVSAVPVASGISTQPTDAMVQAGRSALFAVQASGSAPFSYQWSRNGVPIAGATAASYTTPVTALGDSGARYAVTVSNGGGAVNSAAAALLVTEVPVAPAIAVQPPSSVVRAGASTTLSVTASGTSLAYQWLHNGIAVGGATSRSLTLASVPLAASGTYSVLVYNVAGSVLSSAATLYVQAPAAARPMVAGGGLFGLALDATGKVYSWGRNLDNEMGTGTGVDSAVAQPVAIGNAVQVVAGDRHSLALLSDGTVLGWGNKAGLSDPAGSSTPSALPSLSNIVQVAAGRGVSAALDANGTVYMLGYTYGGILGDGTDDGNFVYVPQAVAALRGLDVVQVAVGQVRLGREPDENALGSRNGEYQHVLALLSDGTVRAWGSNGNGQVGGVAMFTRQGCSNTVRTTAVVCTPVKVPGIANAVQVAAGAFYSAALLADGTVKIWGGGQVPKVFANPNATAETPYVVPGLTNIVSIAAGGTHMLALAGDGTLYAWGENQEGQLGFDTGGAEVAAPRVVNAIRVGSPIRSIAAGSAQTLVLLQNGTIYAWGRGQRGQLGNNANVTSFVPDFVRDSSGRAALRLIP